MKKMIKRKDGSYSQRGLWDNIRANKGSGKKPTKDMLKQESKIKKEENMNSMYKKGGKKTSKKKVMKEAKMEGESFIQENKELSFGAPQMRKGGMKKYENGGPIVTKGLFRDSVSTKVGDDSNYSYNTTVTDKKGRTRKVIEGNYMSDSTGDLDSGTVSKYNRRGELKSSKPYGEMYSNERSGPVEKKGTTQSSMKKKKGGFDLNNDGKTTFKDVLIGRGVIDKKKKGGLKKYEDGGSTTRKNILGQTIKETYSESGAPSFDENRRLGSSKYTKEVYRRDGSLAKVRESDSANKLFGFDNVNKVTKYDREGNVKSFKGSSSKDVPYKKGGAKSMEPGGGGRFAKMVSGLKKEGKSEDSAKAIAASVGRKKYGKSRFQEMAAAGKKRMGGKKC
jgi:hypothetical protein